MGKDQLNVMYLSDDNYAPFAGVSMTSLFVNNEKISSINVYFIDDNLSAENKEKLELTAKKYGRNIFFLDISRGINKLIELGAPKYRNSYTTYLKLFAFGVLPENVDRIFFIDSDSVIVGDLREIITIDMEGKTIAAVKDGLTHPYKIMLGYPEEDSWYNMGVMLVDVKKWKEEHCEEKIIQQLKQRNAYVAVDQDLLNITQHGKIFTLHPKYNATPHHYVYKESVFLKCLPQKGFYPEEVIEECRDKAVIRHFERFIGESPWHVNSIHPYTKLFDYYLSISEWKDFKKIKANKSLILKIEKILYIILPKDIFLRIWAISFKNYLKKTNNTFKTNKNVGNIT